MRAVAQRVKKAEVRVDGEVIGAIAHGLLVYLGVGHEDGDAEVQMMARKLIGLRVFENADGKMSDDVRDVGGAVLLVSQFTLYGDVRKGRRPSFTSAAPPEAARTLYQAVAAAIRNEGVVVETGRFQAEMEVDAVVAGPVTILVDSAKTF